MKKSFRELGVERNPVPQDVCESLKDYAETGAAIRDEVVIDVLKRVQLTNEQLEACLLSAEKGREVHMGMADRSGKRTEREEANRYARVAAHLRMLIS